MKNSFIFFTLIASVGSTIFATQSPTSKDKACTASCTEKFAFALGHLEKKELISLQRCIAGCMNKANKGNAPSNVSSPRKKQS